MLYLVQAEDRLQGVLEILCNFYDTGLTDSFCAGGVDGPMHVHNKPGGP